MIMNFNLIINWRTFYYQHIDSDIKQCKEVRKWTTWQGEDYATECLLDYFSRQKELDVDPYAIQQIELAGQLKNTDAINVDGAQSMFVLTRNKTEILS